MCKYSIGADIGGTSVKLGLFTTKGKLLEKWEIITRKENKGEYILGDVATSIQEKLESKKIPLTEITGIGIGVPGPVSTDGTVLKCANLGWGVLSVTNIMKDLIDVDHIKVGNDANVAALGEMWQGGGRGYNDIIMVTLGTGVGGGVILGGEIVTGSKGAGGEIGHMTVEYEEEDVCGCGNHGCLEQYASATGLVRMAKKALEGKQPSILRGIPMISAKSIWDAAKKEDPLANELVDKFAKYLGIALSNVANVVDPEVFVIGGGVSKAGEIIPTLVKKHYNAYSMFALQNKEFKLAELGNDAGIYGCAKMVLK